MNETQQPGPLEVRLSDQLGRISPIALQAATKAVQAFGCSMAQAAYALKAFGEAGLVFGRCAAWNAVRRHYGHGYRCARCGGLTMLFYGRKFRIGA